MKKELMKKELIKKFKYYGIIILVFALFTLLSYLSMEQQKKNLEKDGGYDLKSYVEVYDNRGYIPFHGKDQAYEHNKGLPKE